MLVGKLTASTTFDVERRYEIVRRLSTGGMATVYLGRHRGAHGFSRLVALKCMHAHFAADEKFAAMFVDEARLTALLRHPNVVPTLDVVAADDALILVMEYVEGKSLAELLKSAVTRERPIPIEIGCAIVHDVLTGLHHAHVATDEDGDPLGIIHRDVSPSNVMVGRDGLAKLLDFGIAKANGALHGTEAGAIRGKIPYMAPEQLRSASIDHRADVYSCGVVLWEALTSRRLFHGECYSLVERVLNEKIQPPSRVQPKIPRALDDVVLRAVAKDPAQRFPTAEAMAAALARSVRLRTRGEVAEWLRGDADAHDVEDQERLRPSGDGTATSALRLRLRPRRYTALKAVATLALVGAFGVTVGAKHVGFTREARASGPPKAVAPRPPVPPSPPSSPAPSRPASVAAASAPEDVPKPAASAVDAMPPDAGASAAAKPPEADRRSAAKPPASEPKSAAVGRARAGSKAAAPSTVNRKAPAKPKARGVLSLRR